MSDSFPSTGTATLGTQALARSSIPNTATLRSRYLDFGLATLVLTFAFLAASFPATNSDLWLHLAIGRALTNGECTTGIDPFGYTTQNEYWANHAWLFDISLYAGFQTLGGAGLVALKAAGVLAMAAVMLCLARGEGPFWISGGFVALAVLAMSPRLLLQPACISLLMLAVCLILLQKGGRARYALFLLIVLWVNLDSWFVLGPLVVILSALGQRLAPSADDPQRIPLWFVPACLAACLISPHHVRALTLPSELSPAVWNSEFRRDARFVNIFASPWSSGLPRISGAFNPAFWAYFALLFLSVLSFAVNLRALRNWRFTVWFVFALLGAWQTRLIPFFAVVAGPIAALNFRERMIRRPWMIIGRTGLTCLSLGLLALTWPGWLQGFDRRDRPLAWEVRTDPSLHRVATRLARWREAGVLPPDARTFINHPDAAHYCVWFCPGEKVFFDSRLTLFASASTDFERVCRRLDPNLRSEPAESPALCQQILESNHVGCLILYDPSPRRLAPSLRQVNAGPTPWDLFAIDGSALVIGRIDRGGPQGVKAFDPAMLVYGASDDDVLGAAPADGPTELTDGLEWWDRFAHHSSGSAWEGDAAITCLGLFEDGVGAQLDRQREVVLARYAAGIVGLPTAQNGTFPVMTSFGSRFALENIYLSDMNERPAELPLFAVRAARRAVASHPDDANAWLTLAQAYFWLRRTTAEGPGLVFFSPLNQLRQIQVATALAQAVAFKPDLVAAHEMLAHLYSETRYFDLALRHRKIQLELTRRAGVAPGEDAAAFSIRLTRLEQAVEQMRNLVQDSENRFLVHSHALTGNPLARARLALQLGLAGKAVDDVLLRSHSDLYGIDGLKILVEVMLLSGRTREARELLNRAELLRNPDALGTYSLIGNRPGDRRWSYELIAYDWFGFCEAAAAGRYKGASAAIDRMRRRIRREGDSLMIMVRPGKAVPLPTAFVFRLGSEIAQGSVPVPLVQHFSMAPERERLMALLVQSFLLPVEIADMHVLEGMIYLEQGLPAAASEQFNQSLLVYAQAPSTVPALPGKMLALKQLARMQSVK